MKITMDDGTMILEGTLLRADREDMTGRTYPIGIVRNMMREAMARGRIVCTLGAGGGGGRIKLSDVAAVIQNVVISNDGIVTATAKVLPDTKRGRVLIDAVKAMCPKLVSEAHNVPLRFGHLSVGTTDENGIVKEAILGGVNVEKEE